MVLLISENQEALFRPQEWATSNDVIIICNNTMVMHIKLGKEVIPPLLITLGPFTLQVVKTFKLLGVTIDSEWSYLASHVDNVTSNRHAPPLPSQMTQIPRRFCF